MTACVNKDAEEFIAQESTISEARNLVEEAMLEKGVTVEAGKVTYSRNGKSVDYSRLDVRYQTRHEPVYNGIAFVNIDVDNEQRHLSGIDHLGLEYTEGLIKIGPEIIEHLKKVTYAWMIPEIEQLMVTIPSLEWDEEHPKIEFSDIDYRSEHLEEMLRLYGENRFENPTVADAEKWLEKFEPANSDAYDPYFFLTFYYAGEMNTSKFEEVLQKVAENEGIPNGSYLIRVTGETFDETEIPEYNSTWNNTGRKVYLGSLDKTE